MTLFADSLRPAGGVSEAGAGTGAFELVDWPEDPPPAAVSVCLEAASADARGGPESVPEAAEAVTGNAHTTAHAIRVSERRTTRA